LEKYIKLKTTLRWPCNTMIKCWKWIKTTQKPIIIKQFSMILKKTINKHWNFMKKPYNLILRMLSITIIKVFNNIKFRCPIGTLELI